MMKGERKEVQWRMEGTGLVEDKLEGCRKENGVFPKIKSLR